LNSSCRASAVSARIIVRSAPESFMSSSPPRGGAQQLCEVRPFLPERLCQLAATSLFQPPRRRYLDFGIGSLARLRIISVPYAGSSWQRDRPPKGDGLTSAKAAGIESRRVRGDGVTAASSELCASSACGPPRDDASKTVDESARSPARSPIQRHRGQADDALRDREVETSVIADHFPLSLLAFAFWRPS